MHTTVQLYDCTLVNWYRKLGKSLTFFEFVHPWRVLLHLYLLCYLYLLSSNFVAVNSHFLNFDKFSNTADHVWVCCKPIVLIIVFIRLVCNCPELARLTVFQSLFCCCNVWCITWETYLFDTKLRFRHSQVISNSK